MTWAKFKAKVEALGVKDGDELWYIDLHPIEFLSLKYGYAGDGSALGWAITDGFDSDQVTGIHALRAALSRPG